MSILLLGKDGQVGWQLQRSLAPHGPVITCGHADCDLNDLDRLRLLVRQIGPSVIVNAAAYTAVDRAEAEPELAMRINGEAPGVLAQEAARLGALLVHYSTDYVFDGKKPAPYVESDPSAPLSVYGRSKLAGEEAIQAAGCKSVIFRTSWVFGARGENFAKTILRLAHEKRTLNVVSDQIGSPTPAALIATVTGIVLAMLRQGHAMNRETQRRYHLCCGRPVSWHEFARTIVKLAGATPGFDLRLKPGAIIAIPGSEYPAAAARPANSRLDCSRLEKEFGLQMPDWQPHLVRMLQLLALTQNGY
ncbi:MAG: dTDP-4-dehydrorhamnose reductase [Candidatus Dechloromonas phosphoritropha]|jgi:dTDP-4-dehydrorhamnose reductase|nr:dTDP-4-dehydrorhamnose reductase [Candidatus Dechloromonas phosphoritropha]MBP8787715.1 dTDP-4-dehydrorhamnose reductase [Azonexus sp.]MBP9228253.1 dTDP-4-dehydrorhamnose reductase [Azonexus sp.]